MKVKNDHRSKFSNLSNWKDEAWKKSGLQRDSNPWPLWYRCDALPTELWSHTLGARPLNWVHIFPWGVKWCEVSLYEIIHIWTAVVDESEEWSSQLIFQFKQLERRSLKKIRASSGSNPLGEIIILSCLLNFALFSFLRESRFVLQSSEIANLLMRNCWRKPI